MDLVYEVEKSLEVKNYSRPLGEQVEDIDTIEELQEIALEIRKSYRNWEEKEALEIIDKTIEKSLELGDHRSHIDLLYTKQGLFFGRIDLLPEVEGIISRMERLAEQNNYLEGKALALILIWQVEKLKKNYDEAIEAREKAMEIMNTLPDPSKMNYHAILFSFAYGVFTEEGDFTAAEHFEECRKYFLKEQMIIPLIKTYQHLTKIYSWTNEEEKMSEILTECRSQTHLFSTLSDDSRVLTHNMLGNLFLYNSFRTQAEMHLLTSKELNKDRVHLGQNVFFYIGSLLLLARIYAERGDFEGIKETIIDLQSVVNHRRTKMMLTKELYSFLITSLNISLLYYSIHKGLMMATDEESILALIPFTKNLNVSSQILGELLVYSGIKVETLEGVIKKDEKHIEERLKNVIDYLIEINSHSSGGYRKKVEKTMEKLVNGKEEEKTENIFANLLIAKLLLSTGNYGEYMQIMEMYLGKIEQIENSSLRLMAEAFAYIYSYLQGVSNKVIFQKLTILEKRCQQEGLVKLYDEIILYKQIVSRDTVERENKTKFQQTIYRDLFNAYSEKETKRMMKSK